jgi:glycosyltransferase involved in cell wall biosynthesis
VRIALFTDTYPDDVNGVARTLARLVDHMVERGHEVALVTTRVSDASAPGVAVHRQMPGVPVPMYPELQLACGIDRAGRAAVRDFRPDLVHVATESSVGFSGRRWALRHGIPLVTSFHTNFPAYLHDYRMGPLEPLLWRYLRWFHDRSLVTFCPSTDTLEMLRARGFHPRLRVWSRGVDTDLFSPARRSEAVRNEIAPGADRILVYVGRLAAEKRVDFLLEVFGRIRERLGPGVALVFVGDGPAGDRLRRDAPEGVHFTGYRTGVPLAEAFAAGDVFAFASDTETFGNVVLESLSSGVPAVVVDKGGVRETVHPGRTGVRVPVGSADAFADACVTLLDDETLRAGLAEGARAEAVSRSWDEILDGLLREYRAAVAHASGQRAGGEEAWT